MGYLFSLIPAAVIFIGAGAFLTAPEGVLSVSFFSVGQGDAVFIESPRGVQVLIDGGPDQGVLREIGRELSFFDRAIDIVIATHPDLDHIGGLPFVLDRYEVEVFIESGNEKETHAVSALTDALSGVSVIEAYRGMRISLGDGVFIDILGPTESSRHANDANASSVVARVVYKDTAFLLTGDAPLSVEYDLLSVYGEELSSQVLKAGHHGSDTSSGVRFIETVSPEVVVFSRGCDNRYGHPDEGVVSRFTRRLIEVKDTCLDGTVRFFSDGEKIWSESEKEHAR